MQYIQNFNSGCTFDALLTSVDFQQRSVRVHGKEYLQPRLTCWYGPVPYEYSGLRWESREMPELLNTAKLKIKYLFGIDFNSVLCNLYRTGQDSVGWHYDDEALFGNNPEVCSLSFGAKRLFKMRRKDNNKIKQDFELEDGSLLFMPKGTQETWQHSIPKSDTSEPRINLTFRVCV